RSGLTDHAELVVAGAPIRPRPGEAGVVEAIAVADGVVVDAGSLRDVESRLPPDAARLDVAGGVVLPGFCDTHMHLEKIAAELRMVQLGDATSVGEVVEAVAEAVAAAEPDGWIQSFGDDNAWHEQRLRERRLPTRDELDAAAPSNPVFLYRGWDAAALNSRAIAVLGDRLAGDPGWDAVTGTLRSPLARTLQEHIPSGGDARALLGAASAQLLGHGITTVVDPGLPAAFGETWQLYREAVASGTVKQRLYLMDRLDHRRDFAAEIDRAGHRPEPHADERLNDWGLKLLLDGEFANAWMGDGHPQPEPPVKRYSSGELDTVLALCARDERPVCFHVMGGGAARAVVDAVERAGGTAAFAPSQVTLAHGFLLSDRAIDDCARLGIGVSVQPLLAYVFEREMERAWGDVAHEANRYRRMIDRGMQVAGGSDVLPCEPLRGAAVAVTRTSRLGSRLGPEHALTPSEALSLFTDRAGAYVRRPLLGTLDVGAPADFVHWPTDPLDRPAEEWPALRPALTAVAGAVVWDARQPATSPSPS
ncbi:MAG: amidohydrolase family protein, partial [Actinomycetota bacterium]